MATNSRMQGGMGVGAAIAAFMAMEVPVFVPLADYADYDLIIDMDGKLSKVQVRTSGFKNRSGNYAVNMRVCGGNTTGNKVHKFGTDMIYDYLFVYLLDGISYLIPKEAIKTVKTQLTMGTKYDDFKIGDVAEWLKARDCKS